MVFFARVVMVCFSHWLLQVATLGFWNCPNFDSGTISREKALLRLLIAVLLGSVAGSQTTDGLWEKHSNNWILCDQIFLWITFAIWMFSAIFMQITLFQYLNWNWFLYLIMCTIDFKNIDIVCIAFFLSEEQTQYILTSQCFCCLSMFVTFTSNNIYIVVLFACSSNKPSRNQYYVTATFYSLAYAL